MFYTGIGSRATPTDVLELMERIAEKLSLSGYTLRSGGAAGADSAFERGAKAKHIYLPWSGFNNRDDFFAPGIFRVLNVRDKDYITKVQSIAESVCPHWQNCSPSVRKLHSRNVLQVLGEDLNTPSRAVIYWAPERNGVVSGGTATAVNLARQHGIQTYNLNIESEKDTLLDKINFDLKD